MTGRRVLEQLGDGPLGEVRSLARLARGTDHEAWLLETGDGRWVVRVPSGSAVPADDEAPALTAATEVAVLGRLRDRLGPWVPEARLLPTRPGLVTHRFIPGMSLQDRLASGEGHTDRRGYGLRLGRFMREVAGVDVADLAVGIDGAGPDDWLASTVGAAASVRYLLRSDQLVAVERFLDAGAPPAWTVPRRVLAHNDLGAEHVVVDPVSGAVRGILDWSDVAIADPAADLGRLLRDLGPEGLAGALAGFTRDSAEQEALAGRAGWYARCLVVENLAYAVEHREDLVESELASLGRLFDSQEPAGPTPVPATGRARRRPRLTDRETEQRMLDAAVAAVSRSGLTVSLEHLRLEEVIRDAGVARSAAYRRWPSKDLFLADVLRELAGGATAAALADGVDAAGLVRGVVADHPSWSASPEGRHRLVVEVFRLGVAADVERTLGSVEWRTSLALHATFQGLSAGALRDDVHDGLAASAQGVVRRLAASYERFAALLGYRLRPELGATFESLAVVTGAAMCGFVLTALVTPEIAAERIQAEPFGTLPAAWSLPALGVTAAVLAFLEPDPTIEWDAARSRGLDRGRSRPGDVP